MASENLRQAAAELVAAADHADDPTKLNAAFNWAGLIQLLVTVIPQVISLFGKDVPAPSPGPVLPPPK